MKELIFSPVPNEQRPINQYIELKSAFIFSWASKESFHLYRNLTISWFIFLPIFIIIETGSYNFKSDFIKLIAISITSCTIVPLLILFRQYLGWSYISNRLLSDYISYEESDWHDGQSWQKPEIWKSRDLLIATNEVYPILRTLRLSIKVLLILVLNLSVFTFFFIFKQI